MLHYLVHQWDDVINKSVFSNPTWHGMMTYFFLMIHISWHFLSQFSVNRFFCSSISTISWKKNNATWKEKEKYKETVKNHNTDKASQCDIKSKYIKLTFGQGLPHNIMCSKAVRLSYPRHDIRRIYLLIACLLLLVQLLQLFHRYSGLEQEQKSWWRYGIFGPNEILLCGVGTQ